MWNQGRLSSCAAVLLIMMCFQIYYFMDFRNSCSSNLMMMMNGGGRKAENKAAKLYKAEYKITIPISQAMSGEVQLKQDDPSIIKYIFDTGLLVPPSKLAYNLSRPNEDIGGLWDPQAPMFVIRKVLSELNLADGFFVECGALDGESLSNTLYLERKLGWKGLLVEGNPRDFEMLKSKNRKAWLAKTCLSIHPYPHHASFPGYAYGKKVPQIQPKEVEVQCLPLFTLLSAINVTTVDYFSLDVDGGEFQVLKTIPFDKLFIKTLTVEHTTDKNEILKFMKGKGYIDIAPLKFDMTKWSHDFLFVHEKVMNTAKNLLTRPLDRPLFVNNALVSPGQLYKRRLQDISRYKFRTFDESAFDNLGKRRPV